MTETMETIIWVFAITALGYLLGRIKIRGVGLGTAAIFLAALVFGHFGVQLPDVLQTMGAVLFIASVGISAGPNFAGNLRRNGRVYVFVCISTILSGTLLCLSIIRFAKVETPVVMGMMTGAYTSSPGFASAKEAFGTAGEAVAKVAAGYGIIYPFGTMGKVLFVQIVPKVLHADMEQERLRLQADILVPAEEKASRKQMDPLGCFPLALVIALGCLVGSVTLPMAGGSSFVLGASGGPLLIGLLVGHLGHIGPFSLRVDKRTLAVTKELGMILFFAAAGTEGGSQLVSIVSEYGVVLLLYGLLLVFVPMTLGFWISCYLLKLPLLEGLAAMTGSMTATPALASLIQTGGTDAVASTYGATYPISLMCMVFIMQFLASF